MVACFSLTRGVLLLAWLALPGSLLGGLVFRCPSCTAERLAACPKVWPVCGEIVREPGCGCCPVCARLQGEPCGVYTPRCCTGQRCYPTAEAELPLQQLIQGLGRCGPRQEEEAAPADPPPQGAGCQRSRAMGDLDTACDDKTGTLKTPKDEVHGTEGSPVRPAAIEPPWSRTKVSAVIKHKNDLDSRMKNTQSDDARPPLLSQSSCEQELNRVLEEISRMTLQENLYELRFPNCDRNGLYNLKQCNMSTHGQRGECWCVDPMTGTQLPATPRVRGDPNCNLLHEDPGAVPTAAAMR
ncbi:LOW QUALITY PROTEIN: insulin-like growth factor-binding protein 2-B [Gadus macrocephalus]|uniref:LOW QUALITY PROTEIN: insulin-like growth factor-binding protein 2-B n=1 Tax=Gadus macrocephalus TaxID=80720 RepID=UPI0028CB9649|nr:LOW QUALITY PROTEIN: insulin-like growth factor-binding protein 2-B [Gadus macrocephalus]